MDIEKINVESIKDFETAKAVIGQIIDAVFVMKRDITRELNNLTSKNVKELDFNITIARNLPKG